MDFTLNDEQRALQESVRQFAQRELPELAREIELSDEPPSLELDANVSVNSAILALTYPANTAVAGCRISMRF